MSRVPTPIAGGLYTDEPAKRKRLAVKKIVPVPDDIAAKRGVNLTGGFSKFFDTPATPIRVKTPFQPLGPKYAHHQTRKYIPPKVYDNDKKEGKQPTFAIDRPSPRTRGMRHVPEWSSGKVETETMQRKNRVVDPKTGDLMINRTSDQYDFKDVYGSVRLFSEKRLHSNGMFPSCHNYPPSRDEEGRLIDYSMKHHGGVFSAKPIRTVEVEMPEVLSLSDFGVLKNSAVERAKEAAMLRTLQAEAETAAAAAAAARQRYTPTPVHSRASAVSTPAAPVASARGMRRNSSLPSIPRLPSTPSFRPATNASSRLSTASSLSSWQEVNVAKDAHIAALRARVQALKKGSS